MNPSTARALDRLLRQMERPARSRKSRFSTAPIVLALGLVLGYQLLSRLVPMVWSTMLPGGLEQARTFRGWPGLVWRLAVACHADFAGVLVVLGGIAAAGVFLSTWVRPLRFLVWLAAVASILIDAGIVFVTMRTALDATARAAGLS